MLFAVGLGAGAIPLAAAINWILKDGLGQLGGVLYGMFFASKFDSDPKRQRFLATIALQVRFFTKSQKSKAKKERTQTQTQIHINNVGIDLC